MRTISFKNVQLKGISIKISLGVLLLALLVSILGYRISPDPTTHANDGAVEIGKQLPGFKVNIIKIRKNFSVIEKSWLNTMLTGEESAYNILPYYSYKIDGLQLHVNVYGKEDYIKSYQLIDVVFPVSKDPMDGSDNFYIEKGDSLVFHDYAGQMVQISKKDLLSRFKNQNIEERKYWLGSDRFGRDLLSRLIIGTRISIFIGFAAVLISLFIGLSLGTLSGYFGGIIDSFILWLMSVVWSIPGIMLVIAVSMVLNSKGIWVTFLAVGFTTWVEAARIIRGQVKSLKEKQFVEAARAYGLKDFSIVFRHIVPNIYGSIIVIATANYAAAILLEAGLSFLGLSVQPPAPSWGMMVYEGYQVLGTKNSWHMILFPGMAIIIMVLSFNLLGIGLQKSSNPQKYTGNL